ncbi:MAG: PAS domain S-box protein [Nitrospirae bacterium]|nr:PAS domain S-box protein [Candidatus Manganitrophaceae bacterium]
MVGQEINPIQTEWKRFIEGLPPAGLVSRVILDSWKRSRAAGVHPHPMKLILHPVSEQILRHRLDVNQEFIEVAALHLDWISSSLSGLRHTAFLVDRDGLILYATGNDHLMREAFYVLPGYDWSERRMGTNAVGTALATNQPIAVSGPEHYIQLFHGYTCTAAPIRVHGSTLGAIGIGTPATEGNPERLILTAHTAYVVEQALMHRRTERMAESMKTEATALLSNALDYKTTLSNIARLVVPRFADWCLINMREEDRSISRVAVAAADPAQANLAEDLQRQPLDPDGPYGAARVIRTGLSELYPEISDAVVIGAASDAKHRTLLEQLRMKSAMVVPITGRQGVLGAITFISVESDRQYSRVDLALAEELARRAALAIENARLYRDAQQEIARRKEVEAALRQSEERFRRLGESGVLSIASFDLSGSITDANDAFLKMIQYSREELRAGKVRWDPLTPPEWIERTRQAVEEMKQHGSCVPYEREYLRKDGSRFWGLFGGALLNEGSEGVAFVIDTTERKRAEEGLRHSEEKYRTLFETMTQGVVYQDEEGKILSANPSAERILGLTIDQMQGRSSFDLDWRAIRDDGSALPGEAHPAMVALRTGAPVKNVIMGVFHPEEKGYRWINVNAIPQFRPGEKKPYQVYATFADITERRQVEEQIRFQANLLDVVEQAIIVTDLAGVILYWNRFSEKLYGWSAKEVLGRNITEVTPSDLSYEEGVKIMRRLALGRGWSGEFQVRRRDGSLFTAMVVDTPIRNERGELIGVIGVSFDITARKQVEEALNQKKVEAEEASRAKTQFVSMISHELRTPLNAIIGYADLLSRPRPVEDPAKLKERVDRISYNARILLDLINNLLNLNRLEAGQMPVTVETVFLVDVVEKIVDNLRTMGEEKGLKVDLINEVGPFAIRSDLKKIEQIVRNLVSNAIKFTDRGSVTVRLLDFPAEQRVGVEVSDTGIGISGKDLSRLFEPFYQADTSDTRSHEGSGLGLSIVKKFADLLGATVQIGSAVGVGTTVTVRIPYDPPA